MSHSVSEQNTTYTHSLEVFQQWWSLKRAITVLCASLVPTTLPAPSAGPTRGCQEIDARHDLER